MNAAGPKCRLKFVPFPFTLATAIRKMFLATAETIISPRQNQQRTETHSDFEAIYPVLKGRSFTVIGTFLSPGAAS